MRSRGDPVVLRQGACLVHGLRQPVLGRVLKLALLRTSSNTVVFKDGTNTAHPRYKKLLLASVTGGKSNIVERLRHSLSHKPERVYVSLRTRFAFQDQPPTRL